LKGYRHGDDQRRRSGGGQEMSDLTGKRAARLLRVSSRGQDEDNQDTPTADYITDRGMVSGPTYRLRGKSATKGQQVKAVRDAIAAAGRGEFDVLVIRAIDRLDRRGALAGWRLLGELLDADLTVLSAEPSEAFLGTSTTAPCPWSAR
jgi:DNA invertase Pin-like site-specific DNA recombinase